jgi:nuclear pore complex protein Nup107
LLTSQQGISTASKLLRASVADSKETGDAEFQLLREAYLPETLLAYIMTLQFGGTALTRDFLMECMDLSALIASEGSDLLDLFVKTGRMQELVEAFAQASKALLLATSSRQGTGARSKKMKVRGWTQELWTVKP